MANEDFHIGNGGAILHLTFKKGNAVFSIAGCSAKFIIMKKKDGTIIQKTAEYEPPPDGIGDGSDGKVRYVFSIGDLNVVGEWQAQGFARFTSEIQVYTSIIKFTVEKNLAEVTV